MTYQRCRECGAGAREVCRDDDDTEATEPCEGRALLLHGAALIVQRRSDEVRARYLRLRRDRLAHTAREKGTP